MIDLTKLTYVNEVNKYEAGMPVLVEYWGTWCPPCREAIPHMAHLQETFIGAFIVAVSKEEPSRIENFSRKMPKMKMYNVASDTAGEVQKLMSDKNLTTTPHCFIYDPDGELVIDCHPMDPRVEAIFMAWFAEEEQENEVEEAK